MPKAPAKETLTIPGPVGRIEALLELPPQYTGERVAVVCHPHPQYQGTMLNKVVHTLARVMTDLGVAALRFNFRGVGSSDGSYAGGIGEVDDVRAVAAYAATRWPAAELWLAGFSFGAMVAVRAAAELQPKRLISIAPAVNLLDHEVTAQLKMPWLILQGAADELVPVEAVRAWVASLEPQPELVVLPGVDHFFHGELVTLRETLSLRLLQQDAGSAST